MKSYSHVAAALYNTPWMILPDKLEAMIEVVELRLQGITFSADEIQQRVGVAVNRRVATQPGAVGVIPIHGVIAHRANIITQASGGTSTEAVSADLRKMVSDPAIKAIILDIDSPGGSVHGIEELAMEIFAARGKKPIVAIANSHAASGAYYLASQADEVVSIPTGMLGSIGALIVHQEVSKAEEMSGIKTTLITSGRFKGEGHPSQPLSDEAREHAQSITDGFYDMFLKAVSRGRGITPQAVESSYSEGRMVGAKAAKQMGMIDRIETFEEVLTRLGVSSNQVQTAKRKEPDMNPFEMAVREALGIDETVDVIEAITALKAQKEATIEATAEDEGLKAELTAANKRIVALETNLAQREAGELVDAAIADGKLAPVSREHALKMAVSDREGFAAYVEGLPKVIEFGERGTTAGAGFVDLSKFEPTPTQLEIASKSPAYKADPAAWREAVIRANAKAEGVTLPADAFKENAAASA